MIPQLLIHGIKKMSLQWLALWKSYNVSYRHDATVWSNNWKDFVVCDEPSLSYNHNQHMHLGKNILEMIGQFGVIILKTLLFVMLTIKVGGRT